MVGGPTRRLRHKPLTFVRIYVPCGVWYLLLGVLQVVKLARWIGDVLWVQEALIVEQISGENPIDVICSRGREGIVLVE